MASAKLGKKVLAVLLAALMLTTSSATVFAEIAEDIGGGSVSEDIGAGSDNETGEEGEQSSNKGTSYSDVKAEYEANGYKPGSSVITVFGENSDGVFTDGGVVGVGESAVIIEDFTDEKEVTKKALIWDYTEKGDASTNKNLGYTFTFTVAESGLYTIRMGYCSIAAANAEITRNILIDGKLPFNEATGVPLFKNYVEQGKVTQTNVGDKYRGDDIRPSIVESFTWMSQSVYDAEYLEMYPLQFYLEEGEHTLTLEFLSQPAIFSSIEFVPAKTAITYKDYASANAAAGYKNGTGSFVIEGEDCFARNSSGVRREYNTDPSCSDYSFSSKVLNTIGGDNWNEGGETATWKATVTEAGLYRIGMRFEQSWNEGLSSYRQLTINGEIPFAEAAAINFDYKNGIQDITVGANDVDGGYLFYLEPGDEISLTVVMGKFSSVITELEDIVDTIMNLYSDIRVITGANPDSNYDYGLERYIKDLKTQLMGIRNRLLAVNDELLAISPKRPGMVSNFKSIADDFKKWHDDTLLIPGAMGTLTGNATNITTWVTEIKNQRLEIDVLYIAPTEAEFNKKEAGFFDGLISFFVNLWMSFMKDYNNVDVTSGSVDNIDVWVGRGIEYCEILREQIKRDFTPETGIGVSVNIIPGGQLSATGTNVLMLSYISGNAPDLVLAGGGNDAIEFAIRDAVYPIENFENFDEIASRFYPALFDGCTYEGHVYALPETMNFLVMYYRTDIFDRLGLYVPSTWDELFGDIIPILYENDMQFWYTGGYDLILYQNGGSFYRGDYDQDGVYHENMRTGLDTQTAYDAFVQYTDMYNEHGLQVMINFYNQFRYGDVPIGIADFTTYMQFLIAAPEIAGKWDIAPIPQTKFEDGTVSSATTGIGGNYCFIMNNVTNGKYTEEEFDKKSKSIWSFMEWWTRADVQAYYASEVEAVIGRDARWLSANIEAFKNSAWEGDHLNVIIDSQEQAIVTPNVLGGYYTGRHLTNAFNRTVVSRTYRPRDSLIMAVKEINKELWTKREEYKTGIPDDAYTLS